MDESMTEREYDIFIKGELIDLVVPDEKAIYDDKWYNWFNDQQITQNMERGMFPNSGSQQEIFLDHLRKSETRLSLMIKPKNNNVLVGTASLSKINHITRQADFAMIIAVRQPELKAAFYGMEAKCLMTEHAFEVIGLDRINSTQSESLKEWQRWQILFGYKIEGIMRKAFRKGYKTYDLIFSSCLLEDYLELKKIRGGRLWPGYKKMMGLIRGLPKESLEEKINRLLEKTVGDYYREIRMK
ncbi:MAG: GNAT family N-acetyltransferase [Bacteroidetes bacterium]|nr:GNAT family N-acetyltransferase [Bacteroidota bacterium]